MQTCWFVLTITIKLIYVGRLVAIVVGKTEPVRVLPRLTLRLIGNSSRHGVLKVRPAYLGHLFLMLVIIQSSKSNLPRQIVRVVRPYRYVRAASENDDP
jgi:hypothetical protein